MKGDRVLVKQQEKGKLKPYYDPNPYIVIYRNGWQVTAQRNNKRVTRNISHFKKIPKALTQSKHTREREDAYSSEDGGLADESDENAFESEEEDDIQVEVIPEVVRPQRPGRRPPAYLNDYFT